MLRTVAVAVVLGSVGCAEDPPDLGPPVAFDLYDHLADPYAPARAVPGTYELASSRQRDAPSQTENRDLVDIDGGDTHTIFDEPGPGVITRFWSTFAAHDDFDHTVGDHVELALEIDGAEVNRGTLAELTDGTHPAFPAPWAADRTTSSGGWQIALPIHFQRRARMRMTAPEGINAYYQIDWRRLPRNYVVPAYDGTLSAEHQASLTRATELWVDGADRGASLASDTAMLDMGAELVVGLDEPAVIRRIALTGTGLGASLRATLEVDGEILVDAPADAWLGTAAPATDYRSSLSGIEGDTAWVDHPVAVGSSATLTLRNDGPTPREVTAELHYDAGPPPADLGRLHTECGSSTTVEGENFATFEAGGGPGHYVGTVLTMRASMWGWTMLEGDHEAEVDGEWTVLGTGTEDYFGGAYYYLNGPFALPFVGVSGWNLRGLTHGAVDDPEVVQFRHHVFDPIPFRERMTFGFETFAPGATVEHCSYGYRFRDAP